MAYLSRPAYLARSLLLLTHQPRNVGGNDEESAMFIRNSTKVEIGLLTLLLLGLAMPVGQGASLNTADWSAFPLVRSGMQSQDEESRADSAEPPRQSGQKFDDILLETRVKASLLEDSLLSGLDIQVRGEQGAVRISGYVNTAQQASRAGRVAGRVSGVRQLHNDLLLRNWTRPGVWQGGRSHGNALSGRGGDPHQAMQLGMAMLASYSPRDERLWIAAFVASASAARGKLTRVSAEESFGSLPTGGGVAM